LTLSHTQATAIRAWRDERIEVREEHWAAHRPAERYDAAVCVGAMEHFATPDASERDRLEIYRRFFARVHDWLKAGASLSLQCIVRGQDSTRPDLLAENGTFPESSLPHLWEIVAASRNTFELRSLVNRRDDYIETLSHWIRGLKASRSAAEALIGRDQTQAFLDYLRYSRMGFSLQRTELVRATFRARPRLNHGAGDEHAR
jgi:cyclopropane-fatty-acyl-phospholipid synthase